MQEKTSISRETILDLISVISPMARNYIEKTFGNAIVLYAQSSKYNQGVFLKALSEDLCVYYAHFLDDSSSTLLNIISEELSSTSASPFELCFNVHGKNKRIIELIQSKGYVLDMEGYVLRYSASTPFDIDMGELETGVFTPSMRDDFVALFDVAYERLNVENGWDTKSYSKKAEHFCRRLSELYERQSMQSFWYKGVLVGSYIVDESYITDIVVHPRFQRKGYGSLMLKHCICFMREKKGVSDIYLRVTKSNSGAKRLYERNGFYVISHFSEHTYQRKK
jgi:ribosomal protein S18 acetylase RimI-like enzyme